MVRVHLLSNTEKGPLSGGRLQSSHARPQRLRKTRRNLVPGCVFFVVFAVSFGGKLQDVIQANHKTIGLALLAQRTNMPPVYCALSPPSSSCLLRALRDPLLSSLLRAVTGKRPDSLL